jgi:hypothetical protein
MYHMSKCNYYKIFISFSLTYVIHSVSMTTYSRVVYCLLMSFAPASRLIHIKGKERREQKDKNMGGGSERHK